MVEQRTPALVLLAGATLLAAGCGESSMRMVLGDGGMRADAAPRSDASASDAGPPEADASAPDAGPPAADASAPDAGATCAEGETRCGEVCVDLDTDPAHCGACGRRCPDVPAGVGVCAAGACDVACDAGHHRCESGCAPDDAVESCASACTPCPVPPNAVATCDGVACGFECLAGFADCDAEPSNGCEADLTSPTSCGACALDCTALPGVDAAAVQCTASGCDLTDACAPGRADCTGGAADGCETDLGAPESCGGCGVTCDAATETCEPTGTGGYACTNGCDAGTPTRCGDACVDPTSDPAHCGACGSSCPAPVGGTATCVASTCGFECDAGRHRCGDACLPNDSVDACGTSCTPCPVPPNAVATCDGTACGFECVAGFADCDGDPTNGCELSLSEPSANVLLCDGFEDGLGAWTVGGYWGTSSTAYRGSHSLHGFWGGYASDCGTTDSTTLASDLDLSGAVGATLQYRHRAVVGSVDTLYVRVSTDGGATWTTLEEPGASGTWSLRTVDLSAYAGLPQVRLQFRFTNNCYYDDGVSWYVDDVAVHVTR